MAIVYSHIPGFWEFFAWRLTSFGKLADAVSRDRTLEITVSRRCGGVHGCHTGDESSQSAALDERLCAIEQALRTAMPGSIGPLSAAALPMRPTTATTTLGQTYHVQHQLESVALKGKCKPRRAALVEAGICRRKDLRAGC